MTYRSLPPFPFRTRINIRSLRHFVEKADRRDMDPLGRTAQLSLHHEMIEKRTDLRFAECLRRPAVVVRHEPLDTPEVHPLRHRAHSPQPQIDRHPISQPFHELAPFRRRTRTSSVDGERSASR
jgi:hypothetical protein